MADSASVYGMRFGKVWPLLMNKTVRKERDAYPELILKRTGP